LHTFRLRPDLLEGGDILYVGLAGGGERWLRVLTEGGGGGQLLATQVLFSPAYNRVSFF